MAKRKRRKSGSSNKTAKPKPRALPHSGIRYTDAKRDKVCALAKRGLSVPEIAAKLQGPSQKTVREWLLARKINPPSGRKRHHNRKRILADLKAKRKNGEPRYTRAQLQEKYGCSAKYLSNLAKGMIKP